MAVSAALSGRLSPIDLEVSKITNISNLSSRDPTPKGNSSKDDAILQTGPENSDGKISSSRAEKKQEKEKGGGKIIGALSLYTLCSVSMVLVNKSLASSYNNLIDGGALNILLVVYQAIVAVVAVEICKMMTWVEYPSFSLTTARQWAPVNILFCLMLFTSMGALQHNAVPLVTVFKNITNIFITFGDYHFFGTKVETLVLVAFGVMLFGAVAAAWRDIHVAPLGFFWMLANCLATAGYVLYMKFATKHIKLSKFGMVFYNNLLCTFFLLPVAMTNGEMSRFLRSDALHTGDYFVKNFTAGFVGFFLNFASLNCVQQTGPTTYAIAGTVNKIPTIFVGYIVFDDAITLKSWVYIVISLVGGFIYSYAKIRAAKRHHKHTG